MATQKSTQSGRASALLSFLQPSMTAGLAAKVAGHQHIHRHLGPKVADWAYANNRRPTPAASALKGWDGDPDVIVIEGPVGSGKTITAARIVAERGGMLLRAGSIDRWDYVGSGMAAAKSAKCLLVDDLGMERAGSRGEEHLIELLCARADFGRPTVVTTMLSLELAKARYPEQMISRIILGWRAVKGEDLRGKGLKPDTKKIIDAVRMARLITLLEAIDRGSVSGDAAERPLREAVEMAAVNESDLRARLIQVEADRANCLAIIEEFAGKVFGTGSSS